MYEGRRWPGSAIAQRADQERDGFDGDLYQFLNPDIAPAVRAGITPYEHWQMHGMSEGRAGGVPDAVEPRRAGDIQARPYGVNMYGFLTTISGLGSHSRGAVRTRALLDEAVAA